MTIIPDQTAIWPRSRKFADGFEVSYAMIYWNPDGLSDVPASSKEQADAMAVEFQQRRYRAWIVVPEGDGRLVQRV